MRRCASAARWWSSRYLPPHQTRHTYAWWLKHDKGLPIEERKYLMRHEHVQTTVRYYDRTGLQEVRARIRQEQVV